MGDMADDLYAEMEMAALIATQQTAYLNKLSLSEFVSAMVSWQVEGENSIIESMIQYWGKNGRLSDRQRAYATSIMSADYTG